MMTCRLLRALLVLALCCCPSVCVGTAIPEKAVQEPSKNTTTNTKEQASENTENTIPKADVEVNIRSSISESGPRVEDESSSPGTGHTAGHSKNNPAVKPGSTGPEKQSNEASGAVQTKGTNGVTQPQGGTKPSTEQANQGAEDAAATSTTKAPTTTTTPVAPSTTMTTEAPTTTTTRVQSRLREVDGSLSSSAWVCAPLLLAASALAYTTLG
ncbi:mucin TcMUCII [Trypanosoma cruzi Dm28c]|uniref:Mucin TcMUCII n=2 Tax=Trypanosoma cruzi TaxID=5693 RepID=V5B6E7_TRYCR|nr:mucin TcMUCII [Trypanosoma cruzi Dm28c]PBJ78424.1 mucin TcMUCII [Trypanosoma cruzi cruzi]PWV03305.1 putative mucin TcMUCII [Trypanosoma cruzi]